MTYPPLSYRLSEKRTAYANFVSHLEYLNAAQFANRADRRCLVRIVKVRGCDGEMTARDGWKAYCESAPHRKGSPPEWLRHG